MSEKLSPRIFPNLRDTAFDIQLRWEAGRAIDLNVLRRLTRFGPEGGGFRLRVTQGMVWATVRRSRGPGQARTGESGDWIFRPGDWLPDWLLDRRRHPAASAVGRLVLEAANSVNRGEDGTAGREASADCPDSWPKVG